MNSKANAAPELRLDNPFVSSDKEAEPSSQYESAMARGEALQKMPRTAAGDRNILRQQTHVMHV